MNKNGVGLGLYIAKQITLQFDGEIDVDSEVGEGSTFTFRFKLYNTEQRGHS
jgi:signal transduction histidine kinase